MVDETTANTNGADQQPVDNASAQPPAEGIVHVTENDDLKTDEVVEEAPAPLLTNLNHQLAQLLADNIVSLVEAGSGNYNHNGQIAVSYHGLFRDGVGGRVSIDVENVELLYLFSRLDPSYGVACWCINQTGMTPTPGLARALTEAGWKVSRLGESFKYDPADHSDPLAQYRIGYVPPVSE